MPPVSVVKKMMGGRSATVHKAETSASGGVVTTVTSSEPSSRQKEKVDWVKGIEA